jgi:hypothetical protein
MSLYSEAICQACLGLLGLDGVRKHFGIGLEMHFTHSTSTIRACYWCQLHPLVLQELRPGT